MVPCSAYCRPDEGLHTYLEWCTAPADQLEKFVGQPCEIIEDCCLPVGSTGVAVGYSPASPECPRPEGLPEEFVYPLLATVQVLL